MKGSKFQFGLLLASLCGLCYALFSPLFNIATNDQFHLLKPGVPHLVVYTTFFYFSTAFFICAVCINVYFLYNPILGLPNSSLSAYFRDCKGRDLAIMAGLICGFGNGFQFMGGQAAGYAAADAVQVRSLLPLFFQALTRPTWVYRDGFDWSNPGDFGCKLMEMIGCRLCHLWAHFGASYCLGSITNLRSGHMFISWPCSSCSLLQLAFLLRPRAAGASSPKRYGISLIDFQKSWRDF